MPRTMGPWVLMILLVFIASASSEYLMGGHMDNSPSKSLLEEMESPLSLARTAQLDDLDLDLDAEESTVALSTSDDEEAPRYHLPYPFAFNGGRPFSLEKDPITGKIDFEKAPPVKALNFSSHYQEHSNGQEKNSNKDYPKENSSYLTKKKMENSKETEDVSPNEINPYSPNFHDFLNLPVHYSSDKYGKDKYPLISSSYANTKVQSGSNSYSTYNHKPYHGETVMYYPTRKPYMPKITSTTTTKPTTPKPMTPSTTVTTTTTTITPKPITTSTTTTTTTTTTTLPPPTTTSTSTKAPIITTWKPPMSTPKRFTDHLEDYDDILPIEKLQASMYGNSHQGPNNIVQHNRDPQTKPPVKHDEYVDSYEDYEISEEEDDASVKKPNNEITKTSVLPTTTTTVFNLTTTTRIPETTPMITTTTSTPVPPSPTIHSSPVHQENIFQSNSLPFQALPPRPVTSMPLDNDPRVPSAFENDNRRHGIADNVIINQGYRPNTIINQRPTGLGSGILVESTSNIVIPPDQDTVSFVLGNRQNVEGGYYSLGTAIGENSYGGSTGIDASFRPLYGVSSDKNNYDPQSDHRGTIGLPSVSVLENNPTYAAHTWRQPNPSGTQKLPNEIEPSRTQNSFVKGTVLLEQPEDKKEDKDVNYVVFPKDEPKQPPIEEHIVVINEADGTVHEIAPSSTTLKPVRIDPSVVNEEHLPQLSENLTPPAERPKPPPQFYYHYHHGGTTRPDYPRPQRLPPPPPRGKQPLSPSHPPSPLPPPPSTPLSDTMGIRRRPYSPDSNLPNILPQFRPNAKTSHGHRGSESIGTIPAGQTYSTRVRQPVQSHPPTRRPLPPPPPSYLQRLNPPPPPIHALRLAGAASTKTENVVPPRDTESTVKRFRLPSIPATSRGEDDVKLTQRLSSQKLRLEEEERSERYSEEPPQMPPRPPLFPKRRTADPPHVATLQMIQHHGELEEDITESSLPSMAASTSDESDKIVTDQDADRRKFDTRESMAEPPVYVVYPVNTAVNIHPDDSREKDESVVVGTRGPHRPLPPETLLQDNEDQDMDEESSPPVHNIFNGRPVASDFPYPLERPDPSILVSGMRETPLLVPSDQRQEEEPMKENTEEKDGKDSSVNVIPYLQDFVPFPARKNEVISATLHRVPALPSSTPIAYVYTPTAQASHRLDVDVKDEDITKLDKSDQKPVLLPSQQPSSSSSSAPSPQNFMAPFVASVSAEAPSKNGWSVVVVEPTINRKSDDDSSETTSNAEEFQTEKAEFDAENFKPQLFGGFKPIYEFPTQDEERPEGRESSEGNLEVATRLQESANSTV